MRRLLAIILSTLLVLDCYAQSSPPIPSTRITLQDTLLAERVGVVAIAPTGRFVVFERIPSYPQRKSYGVDESMGAELFFFDVNQNSAARPLLTLDGLSLIHI